MKKQVLTKGLVALAFLGITTLSWATPENSNRIKDYSDATMVAHMGDDADFAILIGGGSQPYMKISFNKEDEILTFWEDGEHWKNAFPEDIAALKQIILERFEAGNKPREGELFHIEFDLSTSKQIISALKHMLQDLGVNQCELVGIRNNPALPSLPKPVTQAEVINITENQAQASKVTSGASNAAEKDGQIYQVVEQQPEFPGGMAKLMQYLQENMQYPQEAKDKRIQGRVIVQFVVGQDGSISDASIVKSVNPLLDAEAIRAISSMPRWQPGMQRGEPVNVRFTLPVTFRLPVETTRSK